MIFSYNNNHKRHNNLLQNYKFGSTIHYVLYSIDTFKLEITLESTTTKNELKITF